MSNATSTPRITDTRRRVLGFASLGAAALAVAAVLTLFVAPAVLAPSVPGEGQWTMRGLAFGNAEHGCAVGWSGTVWLTADGGQSWKRADSAAVAALQDVAYAGPERVWAAGLDGTLVHSSDAGRTWAKSEKLLDRFDAVAFATRYTGCAAGGGAILSTSDGGLSWSRSALPEGLRIRDVAFVTEAVAWAVGDEGAVLRSADGGRTWRRVVVPSDRSHLSVAFADARRGWIVGLEGTVLSTTDGGESWIHETIASYPIPGAAGWTRLSGVSVVGGQALVVGMPNVAAVSLPGGGWRRIDLPRREELTAVASSSPTEAIMLGISGSVVKWDAGGSSARLVGPVGMLAPHR